MDPLLNYTIKDILQDFRNISLITSRHHNEPFLNKPIEFDKILEIYDDNKLKYTFCPSLCNIYYTKTFEELPKLHYFLLCVRYNILNHKLKLFGGDIRNIYNDLDRTNIYDLDFNIDKTKLDTSLKFIQFHNYHTYYHYIKYNFIDNILAILYKYIFNNDDSIKLNNLYTFYIPTIQTPQITYEYSFHYDNTIYKLKIDLIQDTTEHKIHKYSYGYLNIYHIEQYFKDYEENGIYIYMDNNKEIKYSMYRPYEKVNKSVKHYISKKYNSALIILKLLGSVTLNMKNIMKQIYDFIGDNDMYLMKVIISNMNYELTPSHTICSNKYTIEEYFTSSISCKIALNLYERKKKFELLNYTIANFTCECETCCNMIIYPNENILAKLKQVKIKVPDSATTYGPSEIYYHNNTSKEDIPKITKYATLFPINKNKIKLINLKINYYTNNIKLPNNKINNYEDIEYSDSDDILYQRQQKLNNKQININKKKLFKQEKTQELIQNKKIQQTNINKYGSNKKKYNYTVERKYKYTNK